MTAGQGSADPEAETDRYFVGITCQVEAGGLARLNRPLVKPAHAVYPKSGMVLELGRDIIAALPRPQDILATTFGTALGRYGRSHELSLWLELTVAPDFAAAALAAAVFRMAQKLQQVDAFAARVLHPEEWADNTRPGLTIRFSEPQRIASLRPLIHHVSSFEGDGWPIDGFTTITSPDRPVGWVSGLRYVFLPEITVRWDAGLRHMLAADEHAMEIVLLDQATKIGRICKEIRNLPVVESAQLNWFDVIVGGRESYTALIERLEYMGEDTSDAGLLSRRRFSELLHLNSGEVLRERVALLEAEAVPLAVAS